MTAANREKSAGSEREFVEALVFMAFWDGRCSGDVWGAADCHGPGWQVGRIETAPPMRVGALLSQAIRRHLWHAHPRQNQRFGGDSIGYCSGPPEKAQAAVSRAVGDHHRRERPLTPTVTMGPTPMGVGFHRFPLRTESAAIGMFVAIEDL